MTLKVQNLKHSALIHLQVFASACRFQYNDIKFVFSKTNAVIFCARPPFSALGLSLGLIPAGHTH